ncbi:MAG TPA: glycosyltransferase family 4 protein [Puia sp.]|jgi:glycosyltransferase involved in cell wall biosynthesis|nr:glycosyltransferase family 4 protein [Puia sp.]
MKKILLFIDWFEPGYKAGGPIRSCVNFVRSMHRHYKIYVFTSDRDLGSTDAYPDIPVDRWIAGQDQVELFYCSPENLRWSTIRRELDSIRPDFLYLNSMFSLHFTIYPMLINRRRRNPARVILAPRGMLKSTAVQFRPLKKKIFLKSWRWLGLHRPIHFHASDNTEVNDTHRYFGTRVRVTQIPNFPSIFPERDRPLEKKPGELSIIFVGRVHPIKNLDYLLNALKGLPDCLRLTIIGSLEDKPFWEKCQQIITELPPTTRVVYAGEKPHHELPPIIGEHHIFALPTQGENFGHAIFEAFALGKPVLISDQTPWRNLEKSGVGWDLPLDRPDLFRQAIRTAASFSQNEYDKWSRSARRYSQDYIEKMNLADDYCTLFS